MIGLDAMGPGRAKRCPGARLVRPPPGEGRPAARATREADYGRRGKGDVFGACRPAAGEALAAPSAGRAAANSVDFLARVEAWPPAAGERVAAILDDRSAHRAPDGPRCSPAHPRGEFVFRPAYAAHLNPIEPRGKPPRSRARTGRRCEPWGAPCRAGREATAYGTPASTPSPGAGAAAGPRAGLAAPSAQPRARLAGCTT